MADKSLKTLVGGGIAQVGEIIKINPLLGPMVDFGAEKYLQHGNYITSGWNAIFDSISATPQVFEPIDGVQIFDNTTLSKIKMSKTGVLIATGNNGRMRRSTDGGASWTDLTTLVSGSVTYDLATDNNGTWIVKFTTDPTALRIWRSIDDGLTFSAVNLPSGSNRMQMAGDGAGTWFGIGDFGGTVRSTNNGASFVTVSAGTAVSSDGAIAYIDGSIWLYWKRDTPTNVYRSVNNTTSFTPIVIPSASSISDIIKGQSNVVMRDGNKIYLSLDSGLSWSTYTNSVLSSGVGISTNELGVILCGTAVSIDDGVSFDLLNNIASSLASYYDTVTDKFYNVSNGIVSEQITALAFLLLGGEETDYMRFA